MSSPKRPLSKMHIPWQIYMHRECDQLELKIRVQLSLTHPSSATKTTSILTTNPIRIKGICFHRILLIWKPMASFWWILPPFYQQVPTASMQVSVIIIWSQSLVISLVGRWWMGQCQFWASLRAWLWPRFRVNRRKNLLHMRWINWWRLFLSKMRWSNRSLVPWSHRSRLTCLARRMTISHSSKNAESLMMSSRCLWKHIKTDEDKYAKLSWRTNSKLIRKLKRLKGQTIRKAE